MTDENQPAAALALPRGYHVLREVPFPGSRVRIHTVVIGPTGVFAIHVHPGEVTIKGGQATSERRDLGLVITHIRDAKKAVASVTGTRVVPIICGQGSISVRGLRQRPEVLGVTFCTEARLPDVIVARPVTLSPDGIADLVATVEDALCRRSSA